MVCLITFSTSKFDVSKEEKNPFNPICGQHLLLWLKKAVRKSILIEEIDAEDWGWYCDIDWNGRGYLLGSSADCVAESNDYTFQIVKHRNLMEKLRGKAKMSVDDECVLYLIEIFKSELAFKNLEIEWE